MRLRASSVGVWACEVNGAVEAQASIGVDINVQGLEVSWRVNESDRAGLDEVIGNDNVLLVGRDLDVMRADGGLDSIRVVEALDVGEIGDVESGDVVGGREGEIGKFAIGGDVGAGQG